MGDALARSKELALAPSRFGVTPQDRVGAGPLCDVVDPVAIALGLGSVELFVSRAQPTCLSAEPGPRLVLGIQHATSDRPAHLRFAAGRVLFGVRTGLGLAARLDPAELGLLVTAIVRQYEPRYLPTSGIDSQDRLDARQQMVSNLVPKNHKLREELGLYASELMGADFDAGRAWLGAQHTLNRAGLIASGSALGALVVLLRLGGHRDVKSARAAPQVEELLRYAVSEDHAALRKRLQL